MFLKIVHEKTNLQQKVLKKLEKQGFLSKRNIFATIVQQQNDKFFAENRKED